MSDAQHPDQSPQPTADTPPVDGVVPGTHSGVPEEIPEHNTAPDGIPGEPADAAGTDGDAPLGGDPTTEEQLEADNPVEEDTLKSLDPDDNPA